MTSPSEIEGERRRHALVVAKNLRLFMEARGLTQPLMGVRLGISQAALSKILSGESKTIRSSTLSRMAIALGMTVKELLDPGFTIPMPTSGNDQECGFDVYLSHNSSDKPAVRALAALLEERGIRVWLDEQQLAPGDVWQPRTQDAIRQSKAVAVLVGANGLGPWQNMEMQVLLKAAATEHKSVIPVLLPAAPVKPHLPAFLSLFTWVDFRQGLSEEPLAGLIAAITGGRPAPRPAPYPARGLKTAPTHLRHGAQFLFGRAGELARLDVAWDDPKTHVVTIVAWGGVGKTALVFEWMARLAADGWRGAERVFDWSFYSQGTLEQSAASGDLFAYTALEFFGDPDPTLGSPWDKGDRLAKLVAAQKTLLVLDGLEPLQHPPGSYSGVLKDPAVSALLKGLAQHNPGLCLVTTREPLVDLAPWHGTTAPEWHLERLSEPSGAALLHRLGANRIGQTAIPPDDPELLQTTREVDGHALTLQLLGRFLAKAHQGDVRRRDRVRFDKADATVQGGHAFKVMAAYERWLAAGGQEGERQLAVLRLMGLFDRPADPGPLAAVCQAPAIPGLTEPLAGLAEEDWNLAIADLEEIGLLRAAGYEPRKVKGFRQEQVQWSGPKGTASGQPADFDPPGWLVGGTGVSPVLGPKHGQDARATGPPGAAAGGRSLEAHPLVRDYFAQQLRRGNLASWQEAHRRVYAYLTASVPYWPEGSEGLQPLYQAVAHGCHAGLHQEACDKVYFARIVRGTDGAEAFYSTQKLGAVAADLGAVACFFDRPWTTAAPSLSEAAQAWLLNQAALGLRALGRLQEALQPMRAGLKMTVAQEDWKNAARCASNLSELELTLGDVAGAVRDAQESVNLADRSGDAFQKIGKRTTLADALHQSGRQGEALEQFGQAEAMQAKDQPEYPLLYSLPGFRYCDLLLAEAERAAWGLPPSPFQGEGRGGGRSGAIPPSPPAPLPEGEGSLLARCREVEQRAAQTLEWVTPANWLLDIALDHLTLGRATLYRAVLSAAAVERSAGSKPAEAEADVATGSKPAEAEVNVATGSKPTGCNPWAFGGFFARPGAGSEVAEILQTARRELAAAVDGLRHAGQLDDLPRGLLSRAWLRGLEGDAPGARADLEEAWQTAERGGMRLFMADVLLCRARLFCAGPDRPTALADLAAARQIIDQCEYHRRDAELAAAETALRAKPQAAENAPTG